MDDLNIRNSTSTWHDVTTSTTNLSLTTPLPQDTGPSMVDYINYMFLPITVFVGVAGNLLTILVMKSRYFSTTPSSYLLICLAISDSVLLLTQPFNKAFFIKIIGQDVRAFQSAFCKLYFVIRRASKMTSSWFVVGLCLERFIVVWFPLKAKFVVTKRVLLAGILTVYGVIFSFTGAWSYASEIVKGKCQPDVYDRNDPTAREIFGAMLRTGSCLYSVAPMVILLILTPLIIAKLIHHKRKRKFLTGSSANKSKDDGRVTAMLIGIVIAYVILVLPITVLHNAAYELKISAFSSNNDGFNTFKEISQFLEQLNYSSNFFLYVMTSQRFRSVLKDFVTCRSLSSQNSLSKRRTKSTT